ncbi:MAG: response regulator [Candidatus Paceibacter sp.]|jgi:two-component system alkaline phosphatase synthesis response regulator PhoP|nr:response regulator [Candidatus Paceibacter sp.]
MNKKVLVVDDDPPITKGIEMVLNNAGYATKITLKGEETIDLVKTFKPDLILLDAMLAGLDGREIARELKHNAETANIPIILISANQYMGQDFATFGIDTFIAKPFSSAHLLKIVDKYCE